MQSRLIGSHVEVCCPNPHILFPVSKEETDWSLPGLCYTNDFNFDSLCHLIAQSVWKLYASHKQETLTGETCGAPLTGDREMSHPETCFKVTLSPHNVIGGNLPYHYEGQWLPVWELFLKETFHSHLPVLMWSVQISITHISTHPQHFTVSHSSFFPLPPTSSLFVPDETLILFDKCTVHHANVFWEAFVVWKVIAYLTVNCLFR